MRKREEGMMTVEAVLSLVPFIIAVLGIISFINIFAVHNKIQYALYQMTNELTSYTYFYEALGVSRTVRSNSSNAVPQLRDLLSCRYLAASPGYDYAFDSSGYTLEYEGGGFAVDSNPEYIPMGYAFREAIGESEFVSLQEQDREDAQIADQVLPGE